MTYIPFIDPDIQDAFDRVTANEASHYDHERVREYLAAHPEAKTLVQELQTVFDVPGGDSVSVAVEKLRASLHAQSSPDQVLDDAKRNLRTRGPHTHTQHLSSELSTPHISRVAKSVILRPAWRRFAIFTSLAVLIGIIPLVRSLWTSRALNSPEMAYTDVMTARGERAQITLPDGSTLMLAPESHVRYAMDFQNARVLDLNGEGYFTVIANTDQPFVVRTQGVHTRVLGTEFSVRRYPTDTAVRVVVASGKVAVTSTELNDDGNTQIVSANGVAQGLLSGQIVAQQNLDITRFLGWIHGHLTFIDTPLRDIVPELERMYDIDIIIAPTLRDVPLTMVASAGQLDEMIRGIALSLEVNVTRQGSQIHITPRSR